jgi:hypothetical protein
MIGVNVEHHAVRFAELLFVSQHVMPPRLTGKTVSLADGYHWLRAAAGHTRLLDVEELAASRDDWAERIRFMMGAGRDGGGRG